MRMDSAAIQLDNMTATQGDVTLIATVAATLRDHPGESGVDRALEVLGQAGVRASVAEGRVRVDPTLDRDLCLALEATFALGAARLGDDALVATGKLTSLGSLASSVVHELNNPLFAVLSLVEFLLRDAEPGTKAHSRLQLIQTTGLEMKDLARSLLDFAREEPNSLQPVALDETIESVSHFFRMTAAAKSIEIVERIDGEPMHVLGRRNELRQLLLNLFLNVKQVLPNGGEVTVELRREGADAVLRVVDTGPGVPPELGERAFDAFVTTRADKGALGLGLTVARLVARRHGGELELEPSLEGASFVARLPLVPVGAA